MNYIIKQLPAYLFWDSDISKLDDVEHYEKIIIRTFELGEIDDIAMIIAYYGRKLCEEALTQANYLRESAIIFGAAFLSIEKETFKASHVKQHHSI